MTGPSRNRPDPQPGRNREFFDWHVPLRLQRALLKSIFENYKEASRFCWKNFQPPQAKGLSGDYRRAKIEDEWSGIAGLFRKVRVSVRYYENHTGSYNELTCGRVRLTQSCITTPEIVPRYAIFRTTLARNGQLDLFDHAKEGGPEEERSDGNADRYLYGILTHGADLKSERRRWPAFARVQFPNETCTSYVDEGIDLFNRFPDVVAEYIPQASINVLRPRSRVFAREERA